MGYVNKNLMGEEEFLSVMSNMGLSFHETPRTYICHGMQCMANGISYDQIQSLLERWRKTVD